MTQEEWRQVEELYQAAIELSPTDRSALLERAVPQLRATVNSIFDQESKPVTDGFALDRPAWEEHEVLLGTFSIMAAGAQIGPYRIEESIGRGGMGEVFRATDIRLNRTVAVKTSSVHFSERFEREARAIATLNHHHIATLYDIGSSPSDISYLVLEYVEGPTLSDLIAKGPIEPTEVQRIALEIAEAIEAAHEKGIIHRDLKPSNIKLGEGKVVKVLDFGLAKALNGGPAASSGDTTQHGVLLGTPSYMSPEQAVGNPADRRSDIWSFGVVIAEMLSGRRLFAGNTSGEILAAVIRAEPDLTSIPDAWLPLVKRCLTKDVRQRLQAIGEARIALEAGFDPDLSRQTRKRLLLLVAFAATAALLASGLWLSHLPKPLPNNPLANATFTPLTDYGGTETDASISPDGNFVAFLSDRSGVSHVWLDRIGVGSPVDLTPGSGDERAPLRSIGFSHDGAEIWVAGTEQRRLQMLPLLGGKFRSFLTDKAVSPTWSPSGSKVAFHTSEPGDPIFVAESDGSNIQQIYRDVPDKHNHFVAWGANDNFIYFVHGTPATSETDLWRIASSGGRPERLTFQNCALRDPTPLSNGTILYLAVERNHSGGQLWSYDLVRKVSARMTFGLEQYTSLSASTGGRKLAVTVANPTVRLWSIPIRDAVVTEADVKPFPPEARRVVAPRFRGSTLFYWSSLGGGYKLSKWEAGRSTEIWSAGDALVEPAAISPNGTQIAVITGQSGKHRLRLISADGAESTQIAPGLDVEGSADWSPDGRWIVIGGNDGEGKGCSKFRVGVLEQPFASLKASAAIQSGLQMARSSLTPVRMSLRSNRSC